MVKVKVNSQGQQSMLTQLVECTYQLIEFVRYLEKWGKPEPTRRVIRTTRRVPTVSRKWENSIQLVELSGQLFEFSQLNLFSPFSSLLTLKNVDLEPKSEKTT